MHDVLQVLDITWQNLLELGPYFFLALFIAAMVDLLYLDVVARRSFQRHGLLGIVFTACLGAFSPFCSFTVIPLIRRLLRGGVPLSAVMAFWIASPAMDLPIFVLTARAIGMPLALSRLIGALVLSIAAGTITLILERRGLLTDVVRPERARATALIPVAAPVPVAAGSAGAAVLELPPPAVDAAPAGGSCADSGCQPAAGSGAADDDGAPWWPQAAASLQSRRNWQLTGRNIARSTLTLGKWLVFACVFEGVISVYVPAHFVTDVLGGRGITAIPLAVGISVPLYLNGIGAIPIVAGLLAKGMVQGAAVSFLLGGAVTTIPAMIAVHRVVNNKVFALYLSYGIVGSILLGFCAELILGAH
jgi:uncharacterized membrane protein YraQ (UPF0718 family)